MASRGHELDTFLKETASVVDAAQPLQTAQTMKPPITTAMNDKNHELFMNLVMTVRGCSACCTESLVCGGAALELSPT